MIKSQHKTKIIAHRGDTSHFRENTLNAFEAARCVGADGVELDVHATADGELIVHHDYYLPNDSVIHASTFEYIRTDGTMDYIPTLQEVFAKFEKTLHYEIEIKAFSLKALASIVSLVNTYGLRSQVEFTSPHSHLLTHLKQQDATLQVGHFSMPRPEWMDVNLYNEICIAHAVAGGLDVLHHPHNLITKDFVFKVHRAGLRLHAADCDTKTDLQRIISLEVDQLSTNSLTDALKISAANMPASRR